MSEEQLVVPKEEPVTVEKITELRLKGDTEGMKKASALFYKQQQETEAAQTTAPESTEQPPEPVTTAEQKAAAAEAKKKFEVFRRGQKIEVDDNDNYLGYENFGRLKKEHILTRERAKELENETLDVRNKYGQALSELEQYKAKIAELSKPKEQQAQKPVTPVAPIVPESDVLPPPPELNISQTDPALMTEDETRKFWEYNKALADWNKKAHERLSRPIVTNDMTLKQDFEALKAELLENKNLAKKAEEERLARDAAKNFWSSFDDFTRSHNDFSISKPSQALHEDVQRFHEELAKANGIMRPYTLYNQNAPEWQKYLSDVAVIAARYRSGDEAVRKSVEGVDAPADIEKYYGLADLNDKLLQWKQQGVLGPAATLHDAFVRDLDVSGKLDRSVEQMEIDSRRRGAEGVVSALKQKQADHAVVLPPEMAAGGNTAQATGAEITPEQATEWARYTTQEVMADPEKRKKRNMAAKYLSEHQVA